MSSKIAYFINEYPKLSHSFIRREILALARQGFEIDRIALRSALSMHENWLRFVFLVVGGFPEILGQAKFILDGAFCSRSRQFEYE